MTLKDPMTPEKCRAQEELRTLLGSARLSRRFAFLAPRIEIPRVETSRARRNQAT